MMKAGILGGGQLGRMLLQAAANYPVETFVLENDADCPAAHLCHHFTGGSIRDFEAVYRFGCQVDVLTVEIENVNIEALERLEQEGRRVIPKPSVLRTIRNKILQKEYYRTHSIPTADFFITNNRSELSQHRRFLPAVHKIGEGGYDGRGVRVLATEADLDSGFDAPAVLEKKIEVQKELAVMIAVNDTGNTAIYPPVEMHFDPALNLLDYQLSPARINAEAAEKARTVALEVVKHFTSPGIFAVELFITADGGVYVNETAPRVHNSGHHTIEAHFSSQFDMAWRILLGLPLGNSEAVLPSAMVNIVGADGSKGPVSYRGLNEVLKMKNAFVHLYGKKETRPGRKMGHVTLLGTNLEELAAQAEKIRSTLIAQS